MNAVKYYFAARYSRNAELRKYRDELHTALTVNGVQLAQVVSSWIDQHEGKLENSYSPEYLNANPEECWKYGQIDCEDLAYSQVIVSFTGDGGGGKGGRHIEHGIAIAYFDNHPWAPAAKLLEPFRLVVVGPRENIFHCHPATEQFNTWDEFLQQEYSRQVKASQPQSINN